MYCRKCGASIPDDAEFCTECGQSRTSTVINSIDMDKTANINASTTQLKLKNILNELNKKEKIIPIAVGLFTIIVIFLIMGGRCDFDGCTNWAKYGEYCSTHVCLAPNCTNERAYNSAYCYTHKDVINGNASKDLRFTNIDIEHNTVYTVLNGTVTNKGIRTYDFVEIKGIFKDSYGNVVDTDWTYAVGSEGLAPGESKTFNMSVPKDYSITDCTISIID